MDRRVAFLVFVLAGCGGSSSDSYVPTPTGGGGRIADYVGTYSGAFDRSGTATLTVAADGTVTGTRHGPRWPGDQSFSGTINGDGGLSLTVLYDQMSLPERGFLLKRADGKAFATTTESGYGDVDTPHSFDLEGGAAAASKAPLTTGRAFADTPNTGLPFEGTWSQGEETGAFRFRMDVLGRVRGSWVEKGRTTSFSGRLADWAHSMPRHYLLAGEFVRGGRAFDVRIVDLPEIFSNPFYYFEGLAVDPDGGEPYRLSFHLVW